MNASRFNLKGIPLHKNILRESSATFPETRLLLTHNTPRIVCQQPDIYAATFRGKTDNLRMIPFYYHCLMNSQPVQVAVRGSVQKPSFASTPVSSSTWSR